MSTQDTWRRDNGDVKESRALFDAYPIYPLAYDEVFTTQGERRSQWDAIVPFLETLGSKGLAYSWEQARRMIHENGVTFNVYGDPQGMDRPWELDAIPWVLPEA